jgi:hypothetical protein
MRQATMARQAAERRFASRSLSSGRDEPTRAVIARERAEEFRVEMERIDADQRDWQRDHGEVTVDLPKRSRRKRLDMDDAAPDVALVLDVAP